VATVIGVVEYVGVVVDLGLVDGAAIEGGGMMGVVTRGCMVVSVGWVSMDRSDGGTGEDDDLTCDVVPCSSSAGMIGSSINFTLSLTKLSISLGPSISSRLITILCMLSR
jgi:hypothetical protein